MNNFYRFSSFMLAATAVVSSCQDYDLGYTSEEISYQKNFTELFGKVDLNQTWSTAARRSVSIDINLPNGDEAYQAKIWTADPSRKSKDLYYMADVVIKNGEISTISIDTPSDLATVYVSLTDKTGGTIFVPATFSSEGKATAKFVAAVTRAAGTIEVLKYGDTGWESHLPAGSDGWGYFTAEKYDAYRAVFPENGGNTENPPCESFVFQSDGSDMILYPFYSVTGNYSNDKIVFFVYNPAEGEDYQAIVNDPTKKYTLKDGGVGIVESKRASSKGFVEQYTTMTNVNQEASYIDHDVRTRPFIITGIPAGYRVIFALENGEGPKYSVKELNDPDGNHVIYQGEKDSHFVSGNTYSMAGSATIGGNQYLAFEDTWYPGQYDCQDMAFSVYGGKMVDLNTGSGTAMGFMVAYEDLGNTFDMDFNDIVIKVSHVAHTVDGNSVPEDATVTLLAAGGTMNVVPKYDGSAIFANKGNDTTGTGEAHAVFGCDVDEPVNVGLTSAAAVSATIRCNSNDAISNIASKITMELSETSAMEFTRKISYCIDGSDRSSKIPYAILIASPSWEWPTELTTITRVYPAFRTWVSDATATNWYGESWDGGTATTGDHIGVLSGNTFFESSSICNIDPTYVSEYEANGTTLYFAFADYTANSEVTIKSENGQFTKSTTMGTDGKASIELTGEEFSNILYKATDTRATYYAITAFASSYGVSFGTEAEVSAIDLNNAYSDLLPSDGTRASLTTNGDHKFLTADQLMDYSSVVLTVKTYNNDNYNYLNLYSPFAQNSTIACTTSGELTSAMVAIPGREGIYRISLTTEQLSKYTCKDPNDASRVNGIIFQNFKNVEVAISGVEKETPVITVPASLDLTDGETSQLSPTNTGNGASYTYSSDNTAVASVDASGLITAGTTAGTATITVTVAGTDTYKSASATISVNVTVDSRIANDLAVINPTKIMTVEDTYTLAKGTDFTTSSTGAITYSSNNSSVASVDENLGLITAISAGTAVITISDAGDDTYKKGSKTITVTVKNPISPDPDHTTTLDASQLGTSAEFANTLFTSSDRIDITITLERSESTAVYFVDNSGNYTNVLTNALSTYTTYWISETTTYSITNSNVLSLLKANGCKYDTNNMNNNNNVGNIKSVTITNYK